MTFSQKTFNEKQALRKSLLKTADALPLSGGDAAKAVLALPEWAAAKAVFCYVSCKYEPDTFPLLQSALLSGKRLCVPKCEKGGAMRAVLINCVNELQKGFYGILEPPENAPEVPPEEIDLVIVPCLSADKNKNRLGKGGGYYDRYLPKCKPNCVKILLCRKELLLDNLKPEAHDIKCDILICE